MDRDLEGAARIGERAAQFDEKTCCYCRLGPMRKVDGEQHRYPDEWRWRTELRGKHREAPWGSHGQASLREERAGKEVPRGTQGAGRARDWKMPWRAAGSFDGERRNRKERARWSSGRWTTDAGAEHGRRDGGSKLGSRTWPAVRRPKVEDEGC
ncbi:hypothetical protein Zm00014a_010618 [Zea mays]|uniref:Uncharacterized protein n=1 Tax=Zea mays TaxID=4577 RepID=A0A3L6F771_MAIZE|nr:hypothetical protein Zm00014a_010619 [Zea mays]PWZ29007.1 hypothetical protein Zm00014a_010618 [Zea mays]